jgi:hypothetical protein
MQQVQNLAYASFQLMALVYQLTRANRVLNSFVNAMLV